MEASVSRTICSLTRQSIKNSSCHRVVFNKRQLSLRNSPAVTRPLRTRLYAVEKQSGKNPSLLREEFSFFSSSLPSQAEEVEDAYINQFCDIKKGAKKSIGEMEQDFLLALQVRNEV